MHRRRFFRSGVPYSSRGLRGTRQSNWNDPSKCWVWHVASSHRMPLRICRGQSACRGNPAASWGDRLWQFAVPLLLTQLFPSTLLPNVIVQLIVYAILIVSMPHLGAFVDATNRWHAVRTGILGMNGMVAVSAAGLVVATVLLRQTDTSSAFNHSVNSTTNAPSYTVPSAASAWPVYAAVAVAVGASAVSQIYNNLQTLALEKDWVVELASATDSPLSAWNTSLLRIDMATRIVSPMVYALQMGVLQRAVPSAHDQVVVLVMTAAGWNLLLAPLQYAALHDVYTLCPSLAAKRPPHQLRCFPPQSHSTIAMWTMYLKHPTSVVSLSFCVLYMTVLKENALSTAYLLWHGTAPATVGWSMGSGAYCGLMASWSYPWLLRRFEYAETVAVASVWLYLGCLAPALYVVWRPSAEAADIVLMVVLAASQFWLWTTSLAETQIMQEWVEPHQRGAVNAMQHTANKGFYMAVLVLGIVYADPHQFHVLILASIGATTVAAIGFTVWYYQHR
ncbi:hypothetical protein, variant 1 [Aphanomyces invadans]|uniref:Solute carrier family 40 member n=1 Tax=Aphanomyces invadans TaxID=157072 RepID=A0A024TQ71_9STRA|nr:hypothetical protein, variant 1 [Aphanomyces invadans]ETV95771.1 hypothetical protein, variant 1 [Aphanomyces invadans]|eukprot:XP_008875522.1 hypothetical protein, variant 1 [Aphanomyces invadans]